MLSRQKYYELYDSIINQYPFTQEEDIRWVGLYDNDTLRIKYKNGRDIVFDKYLYEQVLGMRPCIKESDISFIHAMNSDELLIVYKDGKRYIYEPFMNRERKDSTNGDMTEEEFKKEFSFRLQLAMERKGISQEELAVSIGTTQQVVSLYINGKRIPNSIKIARMARVLKCPIDYLFCSYI
jgi:DNA-binding XRE family transcriptional regulator